MDYCPVYAVTTGNRVCAAPENAPDASLNFGAETYGEGSFCFQSSLRQEIGGFVTTSIDLHGCYRTRFIN